MWRLRAKNEERRYREGGKMLKYSETKLVGKMIMMREPQPLPNEGEFPPSPDFLGIIF